MGSSTCQYTFHQLKQADFQSARSSCIQHSSRWKAAGRSDSGGSCVTAKGPFPRSEPEAEPLLQKRKLQLEENIASQLPLDEARFKGLVG
jgi:hypothetical protein